LIAPTHKILIVDDEAAIRRGLRGTLNGLGFESVEAARGEEALSLVRTARFDAILLDLKMPGIGGVETCRRVCPRFPGSGFRFGSPFSSDTMIKVSEGP